MLVDEEIERPVEKTKGNDSHENSNNNNNNNNNINIKTRYGKMDTNTTTQIEKNGKNKSVANVQPPNHFHSTASGVTKTAAVSENIVASQNTNESAELQRKGPTLFQQQNRNTIDEEEMELDLDDEEDSFGEFPNIAPLAHLSVPMENTNRAMSPSRASSIDVVFAMCKYISFDEESSIGNEARQIDEDVAREEGISMEYKAKPSLGPGEARPPSQRCSFLKTYHHPYLDKRVTPETIEERGRLISQALQNAITTQQLKSRTKTSKKTHKRENNSANGSEFLDVSTRGAPVRHMRNE
ncbi:hypothetical protein RFI_04843, partial [Reticulomyxa filosa]